MVDSAVRASGSLADLLLFQSMDHETQRALVRLFGHDPAKGPAIASTDVLKHAFEAGFDACSEAIERPFMRSRDFDRFLEERKR